MTHKSPYTYTILRYVHDAATAEFVNVGVVLQCPDRAFFGAKLRHKYGRLSALFPDLDREAFRSSMYGLERAFHHLGKVYRKDDLLRPKSDASALAREVLPPDDSSLQWSPVGSGLTRDPEYELERLFVRLVEVYDDKSEHRRSDAEVWRPVRERLEQAKLSTKLTEKIIRSDADELEFQNAWKNSVWHCYEPVSFDLADADGIKNKARRWTGHLAALMDSKEEFKTYFFVGAPTNRKLMAAYADALAILRKSPVPVEVFQENEVDKLVNRIESDITAHG